MCFQMSCRNTCGYTCIYIYICTHALTCYALVMVIINIIIRSHFARACAIGSKSCLRKVDRSNVSRGHWATKRLERAWRQRRLLPRHPAAELDAPFLPRAMRNRGGPNLYSRPSARVICAGRRRLGHRRSPRASERHHLAMTSKRIGVKATFPPCAR